MRLATFEDLTAIGQLLHDFNTEFQDPTPGPEQLAARIGYLLQNDAVVVIGGSGPDGVAVLRFRAAIWTDDLECNLAELYVAPLMRGGGLGRSILEFAIDVARDRGAGYMDLSTSESDGTARALYESLGFANREQAGAGALTYYYGRQL